MTTIVPGPSQVAGAGDTSCIPDVVHTALVPGDIGETSSQDIWDQALYWLMGGNGQYYSPSGSAPACAGSSTGASENASLRRLMAKAQASSTAPPPNFDLDGYSQVPASNIDISPATGSSLTIGSTITIAASSTTKTKTLSEFLLFQAIANPSDTFAFYATQSPFSIPFTPTRIGTASFLAFAVFSDQTVAIVPLSYTLTPSGNPFSLEMSAPKTILPIGISATVPVQALLPNGYVDVTGIASFSARSGGVTVFSIGSAGSITTTGSGTDWLDVTYGGVTISAQISVANLTSSSPLPEPTVTAGGVVHVYTSSTTVQPGSWVSIYGNNLAPATTVWNGNFPMSLGGVSVPINSKPAYLWFVSPTQINLQAPSDTATGSVPVTVTTPAGSASSTVTLGEYGPSFSLLNSKYAAAIVLTPGSPGNSSGGYDIIGPTGAFSYPTRPVKPGETLILYGVGFGPTNPTVPAGKAFSGVAPSVTLPQVTIGGMSATVNFGGIVEAGLFQFNVVVPSAGSGDQPLQAMIGGVTTPANVFITVQ